MLLFRSVIVVRRYTGPARRKGVAGTLANVCVVPFLSRITYVPSGIGVSVSKYPAVAAKPFLFR